MDTGQENGICKPRIGDSPDVSIHVVLCHRVMYLQQQSEDYIIKSVCQDFKVVSIRFWTHLRFIGFFDLLDETQLNERNEDGR